MPRGGVVQTPQTGFRLRPPKSVGGSTIVEKIPPGPFACERMGGGGGFAGTAAKRSNTAEGSICGATQTQFLLAGCLQTNMHLASCTRDVFLY